MELDDDEDVVIGVVIGNRTGDVVVGGGVTGVVGADVGV